MTQITTNWNKIIDKYNNQQDESFQSFIKREKEKYKDCLDIYPKVQDIFRCFQYFNVEDTKVVVIGQDPYHGNNQATGLSFEIGENCKYPPTLRNISKLLGKEPDFEKLAKQGVLLLNCALTVVQGNPGSHLKYWMPFTKYIIQHINVHCPNAIFIVWGAFALNMVENIPQHRLYISSHPSPFSCLKKLKAYPSFMDSDVFNKVDVIQW